MSQLVKQSEIAQGPFGLPARLLTGQVEEDEVFSLRTYLDILRRRKWLVLTTALTVVALTAINLSTLTPLYRSTATLQIDPEDKILPYGDLGASSTRLANDEVYLNTQIRKLSSSTLARRVVDRLNLAENTRFILPIRGGFFKESRSRGVTAVKRGLKRLLFRQPAAPKKGAMTERELMRRVRRHVSVNQVRNTRLIQVSFQAPDRQVAADVANAMAEFFVEENLNNEYQATLRVSDYLKDKLEYLKVEFEKAEQALLDYAREKNIVNLTEKETVARKKLADLVDALSQVEDERSVQAVRYQAVQSATIENLPESLKDSSIRTLETRRGELESRLAGLLGQYGPRWPSVKELRREISDVSEQLAAEKDRAVARAGQEMELTRSRYNRLRAEVQAQRRVVEQIDNDSFRYHLLRREADTTKRLYEGVSTRLKQASVVAGLSSTNIRITD